MDLSIIIVNCNTKVLLSDCLASIAANPPKLRHEIIVVDNASSDGSVEALQKEFPELVWICNKENAGFAKANNQGIRVARGKHILLLNSDTLVLDDALDLTFAYAECEPQAGIIGCKVLNKDRTLQHSCYRHPNMLTEFVFFTKGIIKNIGDPVTTWKQMRGWNHNDTRRVDSISGCFFWVRRDVFAKIGLLDEKIFMYYEDAEFCRRLLRCSDYRVFYHHVPCIIHFGGGSSTKDLKARSVANCFSSSLYYFTLFYGKYSASIFKCLCRLVWHLESGLFYLFRAKESFGRKYRMLQELIERTR